MSELKRLLQTQHPFMLALYLTIITVTTVLLFNLGKELSSAEPMPTTEEYSEIRLKDDITNAWALPAFSLEDTEGALHTLDEWKGKVILLNFWATWCPPCKYEIPEFMEYQSEYEGAGFQIIGIGIDEPEQIKNYYDEMGMNYPVLIATEAEMMGHWGNREQVLPYSVVIDRSGEIRYIHRGQLDRPVFESQIQPLIEEQL